MVLSMTGYGKASAICKGKTWTIEIRTLNSKTMDLYVKMPPAYRELELPMRQKVTEMLERGKVDVVLSIENNEQSSPVEINQQLAAIYFKELQKLAEITGTEKPDYLALLLRMPEIFKQTTDELDEAEKATLFTLVDEACKQVEQFRKQEGEALNAEFNQLINEIRSLLKATEQHEGKRIESVRERLSKALDEMDKVVPDQSRFEQELIYYIEKMDVAEEKMRLNNHLDYFQSTMNEKNPGKKLGFITQEIGREINTLGSKSYQVEMQKLVVEMKDNLEKIKEQVLNTL